MRLPITKNVFAYILMSLLVLWGCQEKKKTRVSIWSDVTGKTPEYQDELDEIVRQVCGQHGCVYDEFVGAAPQRAHQPTQGAPGSRGAPSDATGQYALIEAGSFLMGSPEGEGGRDEDEKQHRVTLTRSFWMKKTEVTQGEWKAVMGKNPSYFKGCGANCPVEHVSWYDALAYLNALSKREGLGQCYDLSSCNGDASIGWCGEKGGCTGGYRCGKVRYRGPTCKGYRLPREAEWEYAARAGDQRQTYNGNLTNPYGADTVLEDIAWYGGNSGRQTHPVGQKRANAWGLYDMLGNVREWTWDEYKEDNTDSSADSGTASTSGSTSSKRVVRGGGWDANFARASRVAKRGGVAPVVRDFCVGLRPVRSM